MNNVRIIVESINQLSNILSNQNSLLRLKYERFMIAFKYDSQNINKTLKVKHRVKSVHIRTYSGPHFPTCGPE